MNRIVVLSLVAACGGSGDGGPTTVTPTPTPTNIVVTTAPEFRIVGGAILTPGVRLLNANGNAVAGVALTTTVTGGGLVEPSSPVSDVAGQVSLRWTPASTFGQQTLTVAVPNTSLRTTFSAIVTNSLVGRWSGTAGNTSVDITITSHSVNDGTDAKPLAGTGTFNGQPMIVSGSTILSTVRFRLGTMIGFVDFEGQATSNTAPIVGAMNGSGFANASLTLTKR
jgi:hypothetical protein